jgi:hypothetical protein
MVSHCAVVWAGSETGHYAKGGAIYAEGNVTMVQSIVTSSGAFAGNAAQPAPGDALGGGIYTLGKLTLLYSSLVSNESQVTSYPGLAAGGGATARDGLSAKYSTISHNTAKRYDDYSQSTVGGVWVLGGNALVEGSVIASNGAASVGGLEFDGFGTTLTIRNSTIANNFAAFGYGGIEASGTIALWNTTIARNEAPGPGGAAGLFVGSGSTLQLESTIIADNVSSGAHAADLDSGEALSTVGLSSLVVAAGDAVTLAPGTLRDDPLLGTLQSNGGRTATIALLPGSPAIDAGNNRADLGNDQRGSAFPRVVGVAADVGAFEVNPDVIFANAFD